MPQPLVLTVVPAKAGTQEGRRLARQPWAPAFAGVTTKIVME